jgi:hypothetical protein
MGQVFRSGTASRSEASPLRTLFLLADVVLPLGYDYDENGMVVCLEEPVLSDHIDPALLRQHRKSDRQLCTTGCE